MSPNIPHPLSCSLVPSSDTATRNITNMPTLFLCLWRCFERDICVDRELPPSSPPLSPPSKHSPQSPHPHHSHHHHQCHPDLHHVLRYQSNNQLLGLGRTQQRRKGKLAPYLEMRFSPSHLTQRAEHQVPRSGLSQQPSPPIDPFLGQALINILHKLAEVNICTDKFFITKLL